MRREGAGLEAEVEPRMRERGAEVGSVGGAGARAEEIPKEEAEVGETTGEVKEEGEAGAETTAATVGGAVAGVREEIGAGIVRNNLKEVDRVVIDALKKDSVRRVVKVEDGQILQTELREM